jgi:DNA-binding transcriptional MerR regulator
VHAVLLIEEGEVMSAPPEATEYTIDELAAAAEVPSRTIRFYQSRGALMAPEIKGRVAYYGKAHLERLKLIAQLQDKGLRIDAIHDLVARIDRGEVALAEWLGVERQVQASWANDRPRTVSEVELYELAGMRRPGLLADLVRTRLVERTGDVYLVRSPALLGMAVKLEAAGVDLEITATGSALMRKHMDRAAEDLVKLFVRSAEEGEIEDFGKLLESVRPIATEAVRVIFGRSMERSLRGLLESGKMTRLEGRKKRRK